MRKGFTLIELSIVLVIIGLLVGGILMGQSLIHSVKINRLITDLTQYEVATVQFHNRFGKYPGDSPFFTPPGTGNNHLQRGTGGTVDAQGNGSGACAAAPNDALSNWEYEQFWAHLSQARMLSKSYPAYSIASACGGVHDSPYRNIANAGIYPYTELSDDVAADDLETTKHPIIPRKPLGSNFYFQL